MQEKITVTHIFCSRLREAMRCNSFTQKKLEEFSKIRQTSISDYLNGKAIPSADALARLADALGVTMDYLWGRTDDPTATVSAELPASPSAREVLLDSKLRMATSALESILKELKKQ